jgi:hypothetical protein
MPTLKHNNITHIHAGGASQISPETSQDNFILILHVAAAVYSAYGVVQACMHIVKPSKSGEHSNVGDASACPIMGIATDMKAKIR